MTYFMYDLMGEEHDEPDVEHIRRILHSLTSADVEHPDVSLQHESGWSLSVYADRSVRWENVEEPDVASLDRRLDSWEAILELLTALSRGEIDSVSTRLV